MPSTPVLCPVCGGDARASAGCKACRGAGVSLPTSVGQLVWLERIDAGTFAVRHARRWVHGVWHVLIGLGILGSFAWFAFGVWSRNDIMVLATSDFWFGASIAPAGLWLGLFLLCFLIFRLRNYNDDARILPNWGSHRSKNVESDSKNEAVKDVSPYFTEAAWELLERAYHLAEKIDRSEIRAVHLFAAALGTTAGGIFLTRLGLDFEKIRDGLALLVHDGPAGAPTLTVEAKTVLLQAAEDAEESGRKHVGTIEIFLHAFEIDSRLQNVLDAAGYPPRHVRHVAEWIRVQETLKEEHDRFVMLASLKPSGVMNRAMTAQQTPYLDRFSEDLTQLARQGYVAPFVGRDQEMQALLRAIESGRRSVALVGDAGVGKSALIDGLARRMVEEDVPKELFDRRLVSIHVAQVLAAGDPALAPQRLLSMLQEVAISGNIILVMHGIEALVGAGSGGTMDLAETLASEIDKGYCIVIATTTPQAWTTYLERRSLGTKLIKVEVPELNAEKAIRVLMAKGGYIEYQNKVFFTYAALEKAVSLSGRYLREIKLPESALNVLTESAVLARRERGEGAMVSAEDVARVIQDKAHVPVEAVTRDEGDKLMQLEEHLHKRVIGQDEAVKAVSQAMRRARADMRSGNRPIANFLFLGPTGVGKTELAKALTAEYFGDESMMIRLDMSEYQSQASAARIIGEPGDNRGGLLTEAVRKQPFSIVLLDELEKAHPDILTLFLQVMDDGRLTDGVGRTVDFTNVVLIATSNAGTDFIQAEVLNNTPLERIKTALLERELKGIFRPEFLNRFDGVIVFKPLTIDDVTQIAWLLLNGVGKRLQEKGINFRAEDEAVEALAQAGFDPIFGARPLRRVIQERVENQLADLLLQNAVKRTQTLVLKADGTLAVEA